MRRAVLLWLLLALPAVPARADPIIFITGGSLDMTGENMPFGPLVLQGTRNFSVNAIAEGSRFCVPCAPGDPVDISTFGFSELSGTAMLNGQQYLINSDQAFLNLRFAGATAPAPPFDANGAVMSVPFTLVDFGSFFAVSDSRGETRSYQLVGRGRATVYLVAQILQTGSGRKTESTTSSHQRPSPQASSSSAVVWPDWWSTPVEEERKRGDSQGSPCSAHRASGHVSVKRS